MTRFTLLGPVRVQTADGQHAVPSRKQRVILAFMLLHANRLVEASRLLDITWPEGLPQTGLKNLHVHIHQLRRFLLDIGGSAESSRIITRPTGYLLQAAPDDVDVIAFEQSVERARTMRDVDLVLAADVYRAAMRLWQGRALADVADDAAELSLQSSRLEEHRMTVLEECLETELAVGHHEYVVDELAELVTTNPLRERLRGYLMQALYQSGRRSEALAVYRQGWRLLRDELGTEPMPFLRQLNEEILAGHRLNAGEAPQTRHRGSWMTLPPRQLPAQPSDFVGRAAQTASILGHVKCESPARPGRRPPIVILNGMAGSGKTALALHVAHQLAADYRDGQLYADLHDAGGEPVPAWQVLGSFLGALGIPAERIPREEEDRSGLFRSCIADRNLLFLLDNAAAESQVRPLLPASSSCAVILTSRRPLAGLDGAQVIRMGRFTPAEAVTLLREITGSQRARVETSILTDVARHCGYLPLAIRIAGMRLLACRGLEARDFVERLGSKDPLSELVNGDSSVRDAVAASYHQLAPAVKALFRRLTLLPITDICAPAAAAATGVLLSNAEDVLKDLAHVSLIEVKNAHGYYTMHELVRRFAIERCDADDNAQLQANTVAAFYRWYVRRVEAAVQELLPEGNQLDSGLRIVPGTDRGAFLFNSRQAASKWLDQQRGNLSAVLRHAQNTERHEDCWRLAACLQEYYPLGSDFCGWRASAAAGLQAAAAAGDRHAQATFRNSLGHLHESLGRYEEAAGEYVAALSDCQAIGWGRGAAIALGNLGSLCCLRGSLSDALSCYVEAMALDRASGNRQGEALWWHSIGVIQRERDELRLAEKSCREALAIVEEREAADDTAVILASIARLRLDQEDGQAARTLIIEALRRYRDHVPSPGYCAVLQATARVYDAVNEDTEAQRLAAEAHDVATRLRDTTMIIEALNTMGSVIYRTSPTTAARLHRRAFRMAASRGFRPAQSEAMLGLVRASLQIGDRESAERYAKAGLQLIKSTGHARLERLYMTSTLRTA